MRQSKLRAALLGAAVGLAALPALAQTKVTNQGVTTTEIVLGTHQDLSGPIKVWGVPVLNGMQLGVDEVNGKGGINGRKLRLIAEDSQYDPKKAVLASQKMVEKDKVFAMVGPMGSPTVLASQDVLFDAGVPQLFPLTAAEFTFKFDPKKPQERLKFSNLLPYVESTRAGVKYMVEWKKPKAVCIMYQDDEYGKNVFDGFTQQLDAMKMKAAAVTTYKRGASDFSAQAAKMKSDGCDMVLMGTVIRETIGLMAEAKKIGFAPVWLGATPVNVLEIPALGKELVEGLYAIAGFIIPYRDTSTGAVKAWCEAYFKKFGIEPNSQAVIGYNVIMTFAYFAEQAGKDLTGQKLLDTLESGKEYKDIFGSPPTKFSKTNHLATTITQVQEVKNGRWVLVKGGLGF
jgi:ABC-type branched-subunit amino acid transport system substrate-binding protein